MVQDNLIELFASRVRADEDAVAVTSSGVSMSYGQLDEASGRLARLLAERGAAPEEPVGIFMDRGLDVVAAIVGVVKAGCAYVPMDVRAPDARTKTIITECGIRRIVVDSAARAEHLRRQYGETIEITLLANLPEDRGAFHAHVAPRQLAYVIYTSGSTGVPKGVEIAHGDLAAFALDPCWAGLDRRVLLYSPLNFDASVFEMWVPLLRGGCVVVAPPGETDPGALRDLIAGEGITCAFVTTSLFNVIAEEYPGAFATIGQVWMGGEAASPAAVRRAQTACRPGTVVNVYGPTEATIFATYHVLTEQAGDRVPIGSAMAGVGAYVLDERLEPVAPGQEGELCLGGRGVARGYRSRPAQTAERFVPNPIAGDGSRMYRTGDIVRRRADGLLEFVGRRDRQVKLHGFRIELGEIENQLAARPDVARVAVVARQDQPGDKALVAYVVPRHGTLAERPLLDHLRERLPAYMVPSRCVVLDDLPLTPNGKLDVEALPRPTRTHGGRAPRTRSEETLCRIFADVLGLDTVGTHDDFFELGGHSLLAARVTARITSARGVRLPAAELFSTPTVAALAAKLDTLHRHVPLDSRLDAMPRHVSPAPRPRPSRIPLSHAQRRLWILNQMDGDGNPAYHIPVLFTLVHEPDEEALRLALRDVVARHESLRTVYPDDGGTSYQHILDPGEQGADLTVIDCAPGELDEAVGRAIRAPFDLRRDLPIRAALVRAADRSVLLLVLHHISADGWSLTPLTRDLTHAYERRNAGEEPRFQPLPAQHRDYCAWQRERQEALEEQLAFWRDRLAGLPELCCPPTDRPRSEVRGHAGDVVSFELPAELRRELEAFARSARTTVFTVLHAGFAALLTRLGAGEDVVVGSPVADRADSALDDLVGFMVNTVVLRTDTSGDPSFETLVARVHESWQSAYAHQDVPFDLLVERLNPARSLSHHPFFQVALTLLNTSDADLAIGGLTGSWTLADPKAAKFDLCVTVIPRAGAGFECQLEYARDLFDRATIERMAERLARLLRAAVARPGLSLGSLPVVGEEERAQLLSGRTGLGTMPETLVEAFSEQVAEHPDALALIDADRRLTYGELDERAGALAQALIARGHGPEDGVGLLMEPSADAVIATLGVVLAGAAYVPLDPRFPAARMAAIMAECGVRTVLVDSPERAAAVRGCSDAEVLTVEEASEEASREWYGRAAASSGSGEQLAYVMYTSGSTGVPKGVAVTHKDVIGLVLDSRWSPEVIERVVLHSPLAFDAATFEMWAPLLRGGCVVVAPRGEGTEGLRRVILEEDGTMLFLTTALFNIMVQEHPDALARLRKLYSGGEAASTTAFGRAVELCAPEAVSNVYGPTETTTFATSYALHGPEPHAVPIGSPLQGMWTYVMDGSGELAGVGVPGELYIGGAGVARGYLNRPALTAERFLPDPYGPPGSRMYRTGDLVRLRSDGQLAFHGRLDRQVKIRGFRIEPGEVETLLTRFPGVARATVQVREARTVGKTLVAYVVPAPGGGQGQEERLSEAIRDHLRQRLPAYMVPSKVVIMDALPLTPTGKIDVRALPAPAIRTSSRPPSSPAERVLCTLFAEELGLDSVGVDDGFFALGGHSLLCIRLVNRLRAHYGVDIPVKELFRTPTVAGLAAGLGQEATRRLAAGPQDGPGDAATIARTTSPEAPAPLSLAQQRLWFLDQFRPGRPDYNVPVARRLTGPLDLVRLREALAALVERHDILRTRYEAHDGEPYQRVDPPATPRLRIEQDPGTIAREAARPFDLRTEPPVRFLLVRIAEHDHILVVVMHHIATDGWSCEVLWRDLAALYAGDPGLPEPAIRYADYAQWQQERQNGPGVKAELEYWRERLTGLEPVELPGDRPRPLQPSGRGAQLNVPIPARLRERLLELGRRHDTTAFITLLAAFELTVARLTGKRDIAVGTPVAGRDRRELEPMMGFFVNSVVLRCEIDPERSFLDLLDQLGRRAAEAYSNSEAPFDLLVRELSPRRDPSRNPLFQLSFAMSESGLPQEPDAWGPLSAHRHEIPFMAAKFDLELAVADRGDHFACTAYYATDLFDEATIRHVLGQYLDVLGAVADRPEAPISTLTKQK